MHYARLIYGRPKDHEGREGGGWEGEGRAVILSCALCGVRVPPLPVSVSYMRLSVCLKRAKMHISWQTNADAQF